MTDENARAEQNGRPSAVLPPAPFGEFTTRLLLFGPTHAQVPTDAVTTEELARALGRHGEAIATTWTEHECWLRDEAARLAIPPRFPHDRFFAEAIAHDARSRKGQR